MALVKSLDNSGLIFTDRRIFYLRPQVTQELYPDVTPFTTIITPKGIESTPDPDFKMFEHRSGFIKQQMTIGTVAGAGADATHWNSDASATNTGAPGEQATQTIHTLTGLSSAVDASLLNLTVEIWGVTGGVLDTTKYKGVALITAVSAGAVDVGTVTLKALGNPRASNYECGYFATGDILQVITTQFGEGTYAGKAYSDELEMVYNSCGIQKTPVEVTGTLLAAALRGYSKELARLRFEMYKAHKYRAERNYLLGVRSGGTGMSSLAGTTFSPADSFATHQTDADGKLVRTTMGVIPAIYRYGNSDATADNQNIFTIVKNAWSYGDYVEQTEKIFQYIPDSGMKTGVAGMGVLSHFSKMSQVGGFLKASGIKVMLSDWKRDSLGFNFRILETPHGLVRLVWAPALRGPYKNTMLILDDENVSRVQYRPERFMTNIKTDDGYDGMKDQYVRDDGIRIQMIEKCSVWEFV